MTNLTIIFNIGALPPVPPSPKGTRFTVRAGADALTFGIYAANVAEGSESARVDWGDGQSSVVNAGEFSELLHTYAAPGDYEVFISDDIDSLTLQNGSSGVWAVDYPAMVVGAARSDATKWKVLNQRAFRGTNITAGWFPNFTNLGGMPTNRAPFGGCALCTELHFAAASEEAFKSMPVWENTNGTLGADNATIRFDL